jgi:hypothetical protein
MDEEKLTVDGGTFVLGFRNGLLFAAEVSDALERVQIGPGDRHALVEYDLVDERRGATVPGLGSCATTVLRDDPNEVRFSLRGELRFEDGSAPCDIEQVFRVFDCGVLFCDFHLWVRPGESLLIESASVVLRLTDTLARLEKYRWGYDRPVPDPGAAEERPVLYLPAGRVVEEAGQFYPYLDVAWSVREHAAFTNRLGFVLEEGKPFGTEYSGAFGTSFGAREPGSFTYRWKVYHGEPLTVNPPVTYANRWVLRISGQSLEGSDAVDKWVRAWTRSLLRYMVGPEGSEIQPFEIRGYRLTAA